jgi:hypothetical protein
MGLSCCPQKTILFLLLLTAAFGTFDCLSHCGAVTVELAGGVGYYNVLRCSEKEEIVEEGGKGGGGGGGGV